MYYYDYYGIELLKTKMSTSLTNKVHHQHHKAESQIVDK